MEEVIERLLTLPSITPCMGVYQDRRRRNRRCRGDATIGCRKATSSGSGDARVRTRKESRRMRAGRIVIMLRRCCDGAKISRLCVRRCLRQQDDFADIGATLDMTMRGRSFRKRE